jgi:hypothetical protein
MISGRLQRPPLARTSNNQETSGKNIIIVNIFFLVSAMLDYLKQNAKDKYDAKRQAMHGMGTKNTTQVDFNGGLVSLEQMDIDRKDQFEGDAFDPFSMQAKEKKVDITLKKTNHYMIGEHMAMTEQEVKEKKKTESAKQARQAIDDLEEIDDCLDMAD